MDRYATICTRKQQYFEAHLILAECIKVVLGRMTRDEASMVAPLFYYSRIRCFAFKQGGSDRRRTTGLQRSSSSGIRADASGRVWDFETLGKLSLKAKDELSSTALTLDRDFISPGYLKVCLHVVNGCLLPSVEDFRLLIPACEL